MMYDHWDYGARSGHDVWGGVVMILFFVLLVLGVVLLVRYISHDAQHHISKESDALEILKSRYAKGEIDKKEFDEKKKDLK